MKGYNADNMILARRNRRERNATHQEAILWHVFLKKYEVNFSRQYRIGNYILDFYAPSIHLAIEIDGGQHYEDNIIIYDNARTEYLRENGIEVLRFTNIDVDKNLNGVIQSIKREVKRIKGE